MNIKKLIFASMIVLLISSPTYSQTDTLQLSYRGESGYKDPRNVKLLLFNTSIERINGKEMLKFEYTLTKNAVDNVSFSSVQSSQSSLRQFIVNARTQRDICQISNCNGTIFLKRNPDLQYIIIRLDIMQGRGHYSSSQEILCKVTDGKIISIGETYFEKRDKTSSY